MPGLALVTAPTLEPISVQEAKDFCRAPFGTTEDALFDELITAARTRAEEYLNQGFISQVWDYFLDEFPDEDCPITLPRFPVLAIASVKYTPYNLSIQTVSSADYQTVTDFAPDGTARSARIVTNVNKFWPSDRLRSLNGVEVRFTAGYGTDDTDPPAHIRLGLKRLIAYWYANRGCIGTIPDEIGAVLSNTPGNFAYA